MLQLKKLIAEGTSLKWYYGSDNNQFFEEITPLNKIQGIQTFLVSQTSIYGCESERSKVMVSVKPPITGIISGDNTILYGDSTKISINLTGEPPWQIELNNGTEIKTNASITEYYVTPSSSMSYGLKNISNACGNGTISGNANIIVLSPLGINEPKQEVINVYPVPSNNYLNIELNSNYSGEGNIELVNLYGQNLLNPLERFEFLNGKTRVSIHSFQAGLYMLKTTISGKAFINHIIVH